MNHAQPFLSVVMCTYQGEQHLSAALDSVPVDPDIEVVVVDDGSTDGTLAILEREARRRSLHVIHQARGGSWVRATNRAMLEAKGRYGCILHQDDVWLPGRLSVLRALADHHPETPFFFGPSIFIDARGRRLGQWTPPFPSREMTLDANDLLRRLVVQNFIAIPAPMFRLDLARQLSPLRDDLWFLADWEFWARLIHAGKQAVYTPEPLTAYRVHGASQTSVRTSNAADLRRQYTEVQAMVTEWMPKESASRSALRASRFNAEVCIMLAIMSHHMAPDWRPFLKSLIQLRPGAAWRFLRDSRLHQRLWTRLRA